MVLMLVTFVGLCIHSPRAQAAGYVSRPCGFDINRNGVLGEQDVDDIIASGPTEHQGFSAAESKRWGYDNDGVDEDFPDTTAVTITDYESGIFYALNVVRGRIGGPTGPTSGVFPEGTVVCILADLPQSGEYFNQWVVVSGADSMQRFQEEIRGYVRVVLDRGDVTYQSSYSTGPCTLNFFVEASEDGNGNYLWNDPFNCTTGVVSTSTQGVDIGDSPDVVRATLRSTAAAGTSLDWSFEVDTVAGDLRVTYAPQ